MTDQNKQNDKIKKAFENIPVQIGTEEIWDAIESDLPKKKSKDRLLYLFLLLGVLAISGLYFTMENNSSSEENIRPSSDFALSQDDRHRVSEIPKVDKDEKFTDQRVSSSGHVEGEISLEEDITRKTVDLDRISAEEQATPDVVVKQEGLVKTQDLPVNVSDSEEERIVESESPFDQKLIQDFKREYIALQGIESINVDELVIGAKPFSKSFEKQPYKKLFMSVYGQMSGGLGVNQWQSLRPEKDDYKEGWKSREKNIGNFGAELGLKIQKRSGWYVEAGLMYNRSIDRLKFSSTSTNVETLGTSIEAIIRSVGDTVTNGNAESITIKEYDTQWHTKRSTMDLALKLGYQKRFSRWSSMAEIGVYANFLMKIEGAIPNTEFNDIELVQENDPNFNSNLGLRWYGSIGASYDLSRKLSIYAKPYVLLSNNSILNNNAGISKKNHQFGLFVGTQYHF